MKNHGQVASSLETWEVQKQGAAFFGGGMGWEWEWSPKADSNHPLIERGDRKIDQGLTKVIYIGNWTAETLCHGLEILGAWL